MLASKLSSSVRGSLLLTLSLAVSALGCRSGGEAPEPGAVLLRLAIGAGATAPDELRVSVYDDAGTLWRDARVPEQGALALANGAVLGTVLIQPGTAVGTLRVHVVGLAGGVRVAEGVLGVIPGERARGTFDLTLESAALPDGDSDRVPDAIDDCPAMANAAQGGCPGSPNDAGANDAAIDAGPDNDAGGGSDAGGGNDASSGNDAATDAGTDTGPTCGFAGGCDLAQGAGCTNNAQCRSTFCVDGVCCANACSGRCRACNQPGNDGVCLGYPATTDPEFECTSGMACNGAGACGPASPPGNKTNGEICGGASECTSGFCKEGVCCNSACTAPCQSCGTGTCTAVKSGEDAPECTAPMRCNPSGKCVMN